MSKRLSFRAALVVSAVLVVGARASAAMKTEVTKAPLRRGAAVAPLPREQATRAHPPFAAGNCKVCHERNQGPDPGSIRHASVNEECFECHEDVREVMSRRYKHATASEACTNCHNPHNSSEPSLLATEEVALCLKCHKGIRDQLATGKVQHDAVTKDRKCANCHNPHASNVEKLLAQLPFDLCVNCHSKDGMVAHDGRPMTNYRKWLADNKVWHAPVKAKDCSACHRTHAGDNYRLLVAPYPAGFYASYENGTYALCYGCHNEKVISEPETTTLTAFRDGARNLHYVHVRKDRGRTCRACHEVHASKQDHHIRDGVSYGQNGWVLTLNFTKRPNGGACAKTCHDARSYDNGLATRSTAVRARSDARQP